MTLGEQVQAYEKPFSSLKELAIIRVETHPRKQTHETTGNSLADQCAKQFAPIQVHRSEDGLPDRVTCLVVGSHPYSCTGTVRGKEQEHPSAKHPFSSGDEKELREERQQLGSDLGVLAATGNRSYGALFSGGGALLRC
ncbi:Neuromedin-B [Manis pentadactyla]|nr:Neuromedin-B [Manis pentadactyla]KAI5253830.1 Neuromedin-B [Manis pentadactyla]